MFGKLLVVAALAALAAPATARPTPQKAGAVLASACKGRDGWADPAPPVHIFGNTYYVGTCGITVLLITSPKGHTLIDSGPAEAAPLVLANIRTLGFRPRDVKQIVGSHEHADHMGGFGALKRATGASLMVRAPAKSAVETGRTDPADPQYPSIPDMPPVKVDDVLGDNATLKLSRRDGPLLVVPTPGHTSGGTSYLWTECDKMRCLKLAYVDSLTAISRDGYRFTDHPVRVAPFRTTFATVAALPCDVLITPHPSASNLFARLANTAPLIDNQACRRLSDNARKRLDDRLANEGAQ